MNTRNDTESFARTVAEFVGWFEEVFDSDWTYTRSCMGIVVFLDMDLFVARDGTFLRPKVEDEYGNNWNNRGNLLDSYRRLKAQLEARGIEIPTH